MIDSDNVLLLDPATPTSAFSFGNKERSPVGAQEIRSELVVATIYYFDAPVDAGFIEFFEKTVKPAAISSGATVLAYFGNRARREHFSRPAGTGRRLVRAL